MGIIELCDVNENIVKIQTDDICDVLERVNEELYEDNEEINSFIKFFRNL